MAKILDVSSLWLGEAFGINSHPPRALREAGRGATLRRCITRRLLRCACCCAAAAGICAALPQPYGPRALVHNTTTTITTHTHTHTPRTAARPAKDRLRRPALPRHARRVLCQTQRERDALRRQPLVLHDRGPGLLALRQGGARAARRDGARRAAQDAVRVLLRRVRPARGVCADGVFFCRALDCLA